MARACYVYVIFDLGRRVTKDRSCSRELRFKEMIVSLVGDGPGATGKTVKGSVEEKKRGTVLLDNRASFTER